MHRIADALHMIAAAIWLGAIAAFLLLLRPGRGAMLPEGIALAARSLDRFARVGTICVLVITATGLINVQLILGFANMGRSAASPYGQLLLFKFLLFGSMLVLAAANRWRLTPALDAALADGDPGPATAAIRRSLAAEAAAGAAILALVAGSECSSLKGETVPAHAEEIRPLSALASLSTSPGPLNRAGVIRTHAPRAGPVR